MNTRNLAFEIAETLSRKCLLPSGEVRACVDVIEEMVGSLLYHPALTEPPPALRRAARIRDVLEDIESRAGSALYEIQRMLEGD